MTDGILRNEVSEIKKTTISKRTGRSPAFRVYFFNTDTWTATRKGLIGKETQKSLWCGKIEHIQTGKTKMFNTISQMIKFMEDHRV